MEPPGTHEQGFTLLELMIVVAIIAILIAIAIPTFLGARAPAQDKQAETMLRTSLIAARVGASDRGDYTWVSKTTMQPLESSVSYVDDVTPAAAAAHEVSVASGVLGGGSYVIFVSRSAGGRCFALFEQATAATQYLAEAVPSCQASAFDATSAWSTVPWK